MKNTFNISDIKEFLSTKYPRSFEWNYEVIDRETGIPRKATIKDFTENNRPTTTLNFVYRKKVSYCLDISVSDFEFIVYEEKPESTGSGSTLKVKNNFSNDWMCLLLENHKDRYAEKLIEYSKNNIDLIDKKAEEEIIDYTGFVKSKAEKNAAIYKALSQKAESLLQSIKKTNGQDIRE